mgnify:CR=1 FL=1
MWYVCVGLLFLLCATVLDRGVRSLTGEGAVILQRFIRAKKCCQMSQTEKLCNKYYLVIFVSFFVLLKSPW